MKHLIVVCHKLFRRTAHGLQTTGGFVIQMDALAPYFQQVTLCVPIVNALDFTGIGVTAPNVTFHPLPHYQGRLDFLKAGLATRHEILSAVEDADLALVIVPGYVGLLATILYQRRNFPVFQWVVGDWGNNVVVRRGNQLARQVAALVVKPWLDRFMARLTRNVLTFFNGRILYGDNNPLHFTRLSSSIRRDDIYERADILRLTSPYRLLFVGRLSLEKGVTYLLEAVSLLAAEGEAVELHVVGSGSLDVGLSRQAQALSIADRVRFHGFVPQGEALRQLYRESDLFILPSLQDQQPKVLLEAMSQSVPVIATNVGGIPSLIRDGKNGLLVPPAQPGAIAEAIRQVVSRDEMRRRFIEAGLAYACGHTVEQETARMMRVVAAHFGFGGLQDEARACQQR
jgi:glycosyltransferase involved in cell wall biosynthesis